VARDFTDLEPALLAVAFDLELLADLPSFADLALLVDDLTVEAALLLFEAASLFRVLAAAERLDLVVPPSPLTAVLFVFPDLERTDSLFVGCWDELLLEDPDRGDATRLDRFDLAVAVYFPVRVGDKRFALDRDRADIRLDLDLDLSFPRAASFALSALIVSVNRR